MWRTLFTPRWLALLAVLVAIIVGFAQLGLWQLAVARDDAIDRAAAERAAQQPVTVTELISPYESWSEENTLRSVQASGRYVGDEQFLVPSRLLEGEPGLWVVTPLVVDGTGARLAMVRGFVTSPEEATPPPDGEVVITGALAPGESPNPRPDLPPGQLGSIDLAALVNVWPAPIYNAFVFVQEEQDAAGEPVADHPTRIPPPRIGGEVDWRNLGYALQWWVFAGFAVFMYWRLLREAHRERAGGHEPDDEPLSPRSTVGGAAPPSSQSSSSQSSPSQSSSQSSSAEAPSPPSATAAPEEVPHPHV